MTHYRSFNAAMRERFGCKVYKLALDGGMTCPNRDGTIGTRGCLFCGDQGSGTFAAPRCGSIQEQLDAARARVAHKNQGGKYIAYFQSFTNTYAPLDYLEDLFTRALEPENVCALSVATRPDCLPEDTIALLARLNRHKPVWVELGLQTIHPASARAIRRGYELPVYDDAVRRLKAAGLEVITHVILGLPGESREEMVETVRYVGRSGADGIKLQLLHVLEGTDLAEDWRAGKVPVMTLEDYISLLEDCLVELPPEMVIHRLTGDGAKRDLLAPLWTGEKKRVLNAIQAAFDRDQVRQGSRWRAIERNNNTPRTAGGIASRQEETTMTKIDIFSGFLGAGKTTLIKKLIQEAYKGEKLVLIENEFGEIGIDGGFLQDAGVEITEMNSGCICCTLVGDFSQALEQVLMQYKPDRILIEPSGVGKLSDVIGAVQRVDSHDIQLNAFVTVADATKCKIYMKNFGEFFNNQIEHAACIVLSRTGGMKEQKLLDAVKLLREHNPNAPIVTTPWEELDGKTILETMENKDTLKEELARLAAEQADRDEEEHEHEHHHDHDEEEHEHHHHHDHDEEEHGHHHHDHDEEEHEHHHHHHGHEESPRDGRGHIAKDDHHHHHHHHGGHDADEVFQSWGAETPRKFTEEEITEALDELVSDPVSYGTVLRAKGIVPCDDGTWIHFDYVPGAPDVRRGAAGFTGRLCVIGSNLKEEPLNELFHL